MLIPFLRPSFILLCAFLAPLVGLRAQLVWPGDVNNNGIVNGVDLLYLGWAYGAAGPERAGVSADWAPQVAPSPWAQAFPDGLNYYYADCNGDGFVDEADFDEALDENYGLTHGALTADDFANAVPGSAPELLLLPQLSVVGLGAQINIDLFAGTPENPLPPTYGFALLISFGTTQGSLLGELEFQSDSNNWLEAGDDDFLELDETNEATGLGDLALVRTDQQAVAQGFGKIGAYSVIIEDIVVGLEADTFWIKVDSVRLVGPNLGTVPVVPTETQVIVARNPDSILLNSTPGLSDLEVRLYPNPIVTHCWVESTAAMDHWQVYSAAGQRVPVRVHPLDSRHWQLEFPPDLPPGTYFLRGQGPAGLVRQSFVKIPFH